MSRTPPSPSALRTPRGARIASGALADRHAGGPHAAESREVLLARVPGHAECDQDLALGGLAAVLPLLDGVDGPRGNPGSYGQLGLGPAAGLSGGSDAVHDSPRTGSREPILAPEADEPSRPIPTSASRFSDGDCVFRAASGRAR